MKKYNKEKYKEQQKATMDELFNKIKEGVKNVYEGEKWKKHLETISKFHNYSHRNILLIETQCHHASLVAGYKKWQTEFNRQVKKGQKAIKILMPIQMKKQIIERDENGNPVHDKDGNIKKVEKSFLAFKYTNVFDVSQTEGKKLNLFKVNELTSSVEKKDSILKSIKEIANENGCDFRFGDAGSAKGYYSLDKNEIVIKENMSDLQTLKTAVHELAHSLLHNPSIEHELTLSDLTDRSKKEIEAESVVYVVLNNLNLDTSDYSFEYIAAWGSSKTEEELSEVLENIKGISSDIINKIETNLEKQKSLNLQTCKQVNEQPSKPKIDNEKSTLKDIVKIAENKGLQEVNKEEPKKKSLEMEL